MLSLILKHLMYDSPMPFLIFFQNYSIIVIKGYFYKATMNQTHVPMKECLKPGNILSCSQFLSKRNPVHVTCMPFKRVSHFRDCCELIIV